MEETGKKAGADVAVGSENPVKVAAVRTLLGERARRVVPVDVDSGVSEQPFGPAETVTGARNRSVRALEGSEADLGVGIEGGVADPGASDDLYLTMWAAVTDGERTSVGAGPRIALPPEVAERVRAGEELGPVMDDVTGEDGVARGRGAAGVLTDGLTDRETALEQAVAAAFGPFVTDHYD